MANYRKYLGRKLGTMFLSILLMMTLNFFIFQVLPGDPTRILLPRGGESPSDMFNVTGLRDQIKHEWGLDRPVHERYAL